MQLTYDVEMDILMIHLGDMDRFSHSERLRDGGAVLDLADDGTVLGIEVMGARKRYPGIDFAGLSPETPTAILPPISLAEAARISGIGAQALQKAAQEGRLNAQKIGRNWTTTMPAVTAYKVGRRHAGPASTGG